VGVSNSALTVSSSLTSSIVLLKVTSSIKPSLVCNDEVSSSLDSSSSVAGISISGI